MAEEPVVEKQPAVAPPQEPPQAQAPIQLVSPMERKEFDQFLGTFMQSTGISDRKRAAILATIALKDLGMDPVANLEETVKTTQFLSSILQILPDAGEITRATKDVVAAEGVSKVGKQLIEGPTPEDRMDKMFQTVMPYLMIAKMFGGGGGDEGGTSIRKEFQDFKAEFAESQKDKKWEERFDKLDQKIEGAGRPKEEGGEVVKELRELKAALSEGKGKSEVVEKLDNLTKAILDKERASELDGIKQAVDGVKADVANKIAGLEASLDKGGSQPEDQMKQAGDLFTSIGKLYEGAGTMAKSLGYEPKDEKMTGNLRKDALELAKKALGVFERGFKQPRGEKPEKQAVQQLPLNQPVIIPMGPAQPVTPQEVPAAAEAPPPEAPTVAPFAKKPKLPDAETPPPEAPPETKGV